MLRGRALFTIDGDEHELGPGQLVFVRDPVAAARRGRRSTTDTIVLALGGKPGAAHEVSAWEAMFAGRAGHRARNVGTTRSASTRRRSPSKPDHAALLYNLACMEARGGRPVDALAHLQRAVELEPKWAEYAAKDTDFESIRPSRASRPSGRASGR